MNKKYWWKHLEFFIFKLFYPVKVICKERVPEGKTVIIANHLRALDPCVMHGVYLEDMKIIAKKELFNKKIVSWYAKLHGGMPIDRENPSIQSILQFVRELKKGQKLLIFPEGTRNKENTNIQEIKSGAGAIAIMAKAPIIPAIIFKHEKMFRKTYIYVGEVIDLSKYYGVKLTDEVQAEINDLLRSRMLKAQSELDEYMYAKTGKKVKR